MASWASSWGVLGRGRIDTVMSERPSTSAAYEAGRDKSGKFAPGNQMARNYAHPQNRKLTSLRGLWYDAVSVDDMAKVRDELVKMALTCPVPDIKLKAIVYYLDRTLGKPSENVTLDVNDGGKPAVLPVLSAEEVAVLERVVKRTADQDVVDVEAVVKDGG